MPFYSSLDFVDKIHCKVRISLNFKQFEVKTADNPAEILAAMKLRQSVFYPERVNTDQYDVDPYDFLADHLLILDTEKNILVGTYRLLCSDFTDKFYSESEFQLSEFLAEDAVKLELGRACIHPDYRNGRSLDLLWRGLAAYMVETQAKYLFGCSSIMTVDLVKTAEIFEYIKRYCYTQDGIEILPIPEKQMKLPEVELSQEQEKEIAQMLPGLLKSYLRAGASVHSQPALDEDMQCIDFLTILDTSNITPKYRTKYFEGKALNEFKKSSTQTLSI